jgi:predicted Zn-dependent protease
LITLEKFQPPAIDDRTCLLKAEAFEKATLTDSAASYYHFLVQEKSDSLIYKRLIALYRNNELNQPLLEISRLAADSFPKSPYFVRNAGEVYDSRYQFEEALGYFQQLYALDTLDTMVAEELAILQRKIAYLQRKRRVERFENAIPTKGITLPSLDSLRKD